MVRPFSASPNSIELLEVDDADPHLPGPGVPVLPTNPAEPPTFTFFIYDHLGNSRILYSNELRHCDPDSVKYLLEHVIDYYPFGKTLREYVYERERFQTTYHERDEETGLDFRGARLSDAEAGRFLSTDPLAIAFPAWSPYCYVLGDPIRLVDPTGREPEDGLTGLSAEFGNYEEQSKEKIKKYTDGDYSVTAYIVNSAKVDNVQRLVKDIDRIFRRNGINGTINFKILGEQEGFNLPQFLGYEDKSLFIALTNYAFGRLGISEINDQTGKLGVWAETVSGECRFESCADVGLHKQSYGSNTWRYQLGLTVAHEYSHQLDAFSMMFFEGSLSNRPFEGHYSGVNLLMDGKKFSGFKKGPEHELLPPSIRNRILKYLSK